MQLVASLVSMLLLVWSVRATALPGEERLAIQSTREQSTVRKDAILKMLAGLLDGVDMGHEAAAPDLEEEGKLEEERAVLGRLIPSIVQALVMTSGEALALWIS
ncbi:somatostatin-2 [Manacus vitellinus]|uniref:somatostatin-2 n=1 Tax=Manacus vitellinus TaxID=328815 RepID=UPI00115E8553|nr:somatostatin-2 [Manacus vitellinus]